MSKVARSLHKDDFYKSYCLRLHKAGKQPMKRALYMRMLDVMGHVFADEILGRGIVQLPWGLGDVYLKNKMKPRYHYGMKEILFNDHSEGIRKNFFWISPERKSKKAKMWCFSSERKMRRRLATIIKTENRQYPDFDKMLQI